MKDIKFNSSQCIRLTIPSFSVYIANGESMYIVFLGIIIVKKVNFPLNGYNFNRRKYKVYIGLLVPKAQTREEWLSHRNSTVLTKLDQTKNLGLSKWLSVEIKPKICKLASIRPLIANIRPLNMVLILMHSWFYRLITFLTAVKTIWLVKPWSI